VLWVVIKVGRPSAFLDYLSRYSLYLSFLDENSPRSRLFDSCIPYIDIGLTLFKGLQAEIVKEIFSFVCCTFRLEAYPREPKAANLEVHYLTSVDCRADYCLAAAACHQEVNVIKFRIITERSAVPLNHTLNTC